MNLMAGCKKTELFASNPRAESFTKGIYIPTRLLSLPEFSALDGETPVDALDPKIQVSFIDTEGQGAVGGEYDMDLFSPALVTSRVIIYNRTGGLETDRILQDLGMMTQAAQRLSVIPQVSGTAEGSITSDVFSTTGGVTSVTNGTNGTNTTNKSTTATVVHGSDSSPSSSGATFMFGHLRILFNQYRLNSTDDG